MSAAAFLQTTGSALPWGWAAEVMVMPYRSNSDLPPSVQAHLPPHAQDIYREAFNHAFAAHVGDPRQEEAAHRIAWAAVKRSYVKVGGSWIGRDRS
jgi:cation transport regulator